MSGASCTHEPDTLFLFSFRLQPFLGCFLPRTAGYPMHTRILLPVDHRFDERRVTTTIIIVRPAAYIIYMYIPDVNQIMCIKKLFLKKKNNNNNKTGAPGPRPYNYTCYYAYLRRRTRFLGYTIDDDGGAHRVLLLIHY